MAGPEELRPAAGLASHSHRRAGQTFTIPHARLSYSLFTVGTPGPLGSQVSDSSDQGSAMHTDRQTLCNRDGDTAEIATPLLRIGPSAEAGAARDIHPADMRSVNEPTPGWVWLLVGVVLTIAVIKFM